jgi:hypothetical protein
VKPAGIRGAEPPEDALTTLADRPLDTPAPSRLDPDAPDYREIVQEHREAMDLGRPGYLDPRSGLFVMTATYLASRGWCCRSGCRHCPYVAD